MSYFIEDRLPNGIGLFVWPTEKFKTITIRLVLRRPLRRSEATMNALLPMVLKRGSKRLPRALELSQALDDLYGADLRSDTAKVGEQQFLIFHLELPAERYVPGHSSLLPQGLRLLSEMSSDPVLDDRGFRSDYVQQEKANLKQLIDGLINDKGQYAQLRCIEQMFAGEPYALSRFGTVEDLPGVDGRNLYAHFETVWQQSPVALYAVGAIDPKLFKAMASEAFPRSNPKAELPFAFAEVSRPQKVHTVHEHQEVSQGKLVLGFRATPLANAQEFPALVMANGIYGGFSHSKLFQSVREKASLAYYAYARLDGLKGVVLVNAGIDRSNYDQALSLIQEELHQLKHGEISDDEFDKTRLALENQIRASEDAPAQVMMSHLELSLSGRPTALDDRLAALRRVTRDDVVAAAQGIELDTVYFLSGEEKDHA